MKKYNVMERYPVVVDASEVNDCLEQIETSVTCLLKSIDSAVKSIKSTLDGAERTEFQLTLEDVKDCLADWLDGELDKAVIDECKAVIKGCVKEVRGLIENPNGDGVPDCIREALPPKGLMTGDDTELAEVIKQWCNSHGYYVP